MDAGLMIRYVDYINGVRTNNRSAPTMMVYDSFRGHLEDSVKDKFRISGIDLAVIPGGLTSVCQPLDVAINKPFKDHLRKEWHLWMAKGGAGKTTAGNLRRAKISDVCGWVKRSWEQISTEVFIESFVKCGISNELGDINSDESEGSNENEDFEIIDLSNNQL